MPNPPRKTTYCDVSDYQYPGILSQLQPMYDSGVRILIIKVTQGTRHVQKHYREVYEAAKRIGFVVTFYHFCTNDNGIEQAAWCKQNVGDLKIDLPLMMDVEAFTATYIMGASDWEDDLEICPVIPFRYGVTEAGLMRLMSAPDGERYTFEYPEEAIMWVIADRLRDFQGKGETMIYTNLATALKALTGSSWSKHPLNVAHWGIDVPRVPAAWKNAGKAYTLWQMGVYNLWGQNIDCGRWNEEVYPAPWTPTPSPSGKSRLHAELTVRETGDRFVLDAEAKE